MTNPLEHDRIRRAVSGDLVALDRLLLDCYDPLLRYIAGRWAPAREPAVGAEDVLQQVFAQACRDIGSFEVREGASFLSWLKAIAENRMRDTIRARQRQKRGGENQRVFAVDGDAPFVKDLVEEFMVHSMTPSRELARQEVIGAVQAALVELPEDHRRAVQLRYFQGLSTEETARVMGRTTGSVRGLLDRARERIRESLETASRYLSRG